MPLPEPSVEALAHSGRLAALIRREIAAQGGWISFARYMELALYAPGLGYYSAGAAKLGRAGDFVTAPEISPLFGRTLARQVAQVLEAGGDVLELGAGSGRLAADMLAELERLDALPERYLILEVSADLRSRQRETLFQLAPRLAPRVGWLDGMPESFRGMVVGNEVLDALPVHLVVWRGGKIFERGVGLDGAGFAWREREPGPGELRRIAERLCPGEDYLSEIGLVARGFVRSLARALDRGVVLLLDYGFGEREYYHPQRNRGTLMCHYRHRAHDDPFFLPGLQDITAHVDFSAVGESAASEGLELLGYTTQASFLIHCGITEILGQTDPNDAAAYLPLANQVLRLTSPAEMGELFKAMALGKGVDGPLLGFGPYSGRGL